VNKDIVSDANSEQIEIRTEVTVKTEPAKEVGGTHGRLGHQILIAVAALIIVGGVLLAGALPRIRARSKVDSATQVLAVPTVSVVRPQLAAPTQELILPGNMQAFSDSPIFARTNGYLKAWYVDIGARVKKGQLLAEIETPEVDQQLDQARADLATAQANYKLSQITAARYQDLLKSDSVSQQATDNAQGDFEARAAMVQSAQDNVRRLEELVSFEKIYAPFDGVITARNVDIGDLIDAGATGGTAQQLFHIVSTRVLRVYVSIPQIDSQVATPGLQAYLTLPEFPGRKFPGRLVRDADALDATSRTLNTEIDVENPTGELRPGAYAEVHLRLPEDARTFMLPVDTLIFRAAGLQVATVDGGQAKLVHVTLGQDYGDHVQVVAGLAGDESVIENPPDSLLTGEPVRVSQTPASGEGQ
jgi:RND family efflux transporter MFP subunit